MSLPRGVRLVVRLAAAGAVWVVARLLRAVWNVIGRDVDDVTPQTVQVPQSSERVNVYADGSGSLTIPFRGMSVIVSPLDDGSWGWIVRSGSLKWTGVNERRDDALRCAFLVAIEKQRICMM